jgi:hypothetical protein
LLRPRRRWFSIQILCDISDLSGSWSRNRSGHFDRFCHTRSGHRIGGARRLAHASKRGACLQARCGDSIPSGRAVN